MLCPHVLLSYYHCRPPTLGLYHFFIHIARLERLLLPHFEHQVVQCIVQGWLGLLLSLLVSSLDYLAGARAPCFLIDLVSEPYATAPLWLNFGQILDGDRRSLAPDHSAIERVAEAQGKDQGEGWALVV